ncbi:MAG: hypothetical protein U9O87_06355 [Verrucomicrobiota bacterium]|nr:hypothetical protein [Verrucomicrobiota bacterium]
MKTHVIVPPTKQTKYVILGSNDKIIKYFESAKELQKSIKPIKMKNNKPIIPKTTLVDIPDVTQTYIY